MGALIRIVAWLLALALVTLPVLAVLNGWVMPDRWPMRRLEVTAEFQHVSAEQIRTTVASQIGRGYFDTDPAAIRNALAELPWVEQVRVRKRWPDRLEVQLLEYRARARWGETRLLSDQGVLFTTPGADELQGLPQLSGPEERLAEVLAFHEAAQRQLSSIGLQLRGTTLSRRGSWTLLLADGSSIVVGRNAEPAARLARLVRALPQLLAGEQRVFARIDLRYSNGFAIQWARPDGETRLVPEAQDVPDTAEQPRAAAPMVAPAPHLPSPFPSLSDFRYPA